MNSEWSSKARLRVMVTSARKRFKTEAYRTQVWEKLLRMEKK